MAKCYFCDFIYNLISNSSKLFDDHTSSLTFYFQRGTSVQSFGGVTTSCAGAAGNNKSSRIIPQTQVPV